MKQKQDELVVITKTYDLILWSCNHTSRFPRNHRFVLGERIERRLYDLLETLIEAKYTKDRKPLLESYNLKLEILRFQFRLAKDLKCRAVRGSPDPARFLTAGLLCLGETVSHPGRRDLRSKPRRGQRPAPSAGEAKTCAERGTLAERRAHQHDFAAANPIGKE